MGERSARRAFGRSHRRASSAWRAITIAALASTLIVSLADRSGLLQRVELDIYDALLRLTSDYPRDDRLLIVAIDDQDIIRHGHPLSDSKLAETIEKIRRNGPRAVGLNLYRHLEHPPGTAALSEQLAAPEVIAVHYVGLDPERVQVPSPAGIPTERIGFNDLVIDPDGVVRRALLYVGGRETGHYSFALRCVLAANDQSGGSFRVEVDDSLVLAGREVPRLTSSAGGYANVDNAGYQTLLRYRARQEAVDMVTISEILTDSVSRDRIEDRLVIIGSVAASLENEFYTPYSAELDQGFTMPGVMVHAQIMSQLLDVVEGQDATVGAPPLLQETLWLFFWALTSALLAWFVRSPAVLLLTFTATLVIIGLAGFVGLNNLFWLPVFAPCLAVLGALAAMLSQKYLWRVTYDKVTGLLNREAFIRRVDRALQKSDGNSVSIGVFHIDRIELIKKSLGQDASDRFLIRLACRMRKCVAANEDLSRIDGNEFALLLRGLDQQLIDERLAELRSLISSPMQFETRQVSISASIGAAMALDADVLTATDLLRDAETAMYGAKSQRAVQFEIFSSDMRKQALAQLELQSDLHKAVENKDFSLQYQPIITLGSEEIFGFEALLRWQSETHGNLPPSTFIPVLEETGMIVPLGRWILDTACAQASEWRRLCPGRAIQINVNLSSRQIDQPGLDEIIRTSLENANLPAKDLQLELTESSIMADLDSMQDLIVKLKAIGIGLAIDDFGTGYSSLSHLHRFPFDTIKIDRSFVQSMAEGEVDRAIVDTIIDLGNRLGMKLLAEGIESRAQADALKAAGCHYAQGYYFSKPRSAEDATRMLTETSPWIK